MSEIPVDSMTGLRTMTPEGVLERSRLNTLNTAQAIRQRVLSKQVRSNGKASRDFAQGERFALGLDELRLIGGQ